MKDINGLWFKVLGVLRGIIPFYDLMNRVMSFNRDYKYRLEALKMTVRGGELMLDAGSGPGNLTCLALKTGVAEVVLLDPLLDMHFEARRRLLKTGKVHFVLGVFEAPPFRRCCFDLVGCSFSLRDARDLFGSIEKLSENLRDNGYFSMVEIGKPRNTFLRVALYFYWRIVVPAMAILVVKGNWRKYTLLEQTYLRLPVNDQLQRFLEGIYRRVKVERKLFGAVVLAVGKGRKLQRISRKAYIHQGLQ